MLGKILGGVIGANAAKAAGGAGAGGALLGVVSATVLRRMSVPALIAVTAGGYALKKWKEKRDAEGAAPAASTTKAAPKSAPRKAPDA